jgi:hypothetical protein
VQILVGEKSTPFSIHSDLLLQSSEYFTRACGTNTHDGDTKPTHLPDASEDVFFIFQRLLLMRVRRSYAAQGAALNDDSLAHVPVDNPDTTIESLTPTDSDNSEDEDYN